MVANCHKAKQNKLRVPRFPARRLVWTLPLKHPNKADYKVCTVMYELVCIFNRYKLMLKSTLIACAYISDVLHTFADLEYTYICMYVYTHTHT